MNKILKNYVIGSIFIFLGVLFLFTLFTGVINSNLKEFLEVFENKTFDIRQRMTSQHREHNKDIVILAIDDSTYEETIEKYGEWPMPRYIYADVVDYIEQQKPKLIAFDLLFVKTIKDKFNSDEKISNVFKKYDNVFTSMTFDTLETELRAPTPIRDELSVNVKNDASVKIEKFLNYKPIISSITDNTTNIGHINFKRASDGVIRDLWPFVQYDYDKKMYPHMALLVAQKLLNTNTKDFVIDKDLKLKFANKSYPITKSGTIYLNWYKISNTEENEEYDPQVFQHIPLWKVVKSIEHEKNGKPAEIEKDFFKDKIVYIGTTSPYLNDIKTVPIYERLPGVELHTTFINNILDNSFVRRATFEWDFGITLILCLIIGLSMLRVEYSKINYKYYTPIHFSILIGTLLVYYILSYQLMLHKNIWIANVMPAIGAMLTFIGVYVVRYFFKSRDYEYTYRLATTDGLTELYNHRYFQEQMIASIEECKASNKNFSLILTDIDFFKKFNDKYGHQAGDAVLRQVAKTLKTNVKKCDLVCRYGGEEMSVILKNTNKEIALQIAQRLCDAVANTICKLGPNLESNVTISLGVSTYPQDGATPSELIEYSDKGLYYAKENGRNQVGVVKN